MTRTNRWLRYAAATILVAAVVPLTTAAADDGVGTLDGIPELVSDAELDSDLVAGSTVTITPAQWTEPLLFLSVYVLLCPGQEASIECVHLTPTSGYTYTIPADAAGQYLLVETDGWWDLMILFTNDTWFGPVASAEPQPDGVPTVTGTLIVGETLTANNTTWSGAEPISYTYNWFMCFDPAGDDCVPRDTDTDTYEIVGDDAGRYLYVQITGTNDHGSNTASSGITDIVAGSPMNTEAPVITSGALPSPTPGETANVSTGEWETYGLPMDSLTYQWLSCPNEYSVESCAVIAGATSEAYVPTESDLGQYLRAEVEVTTIAGTNAALSDASAQVAYHTPQNTTMPTISGGSGPAGAPVVGDLLDADVGEWTSDGDVEFTVTWHLCDPIGDLMSIAAPPSCDTPAGEGLEVTVDPGWVGHPIEARVTATNEFGFNTVHTDQTPAVLAAAPQNLTAPTVTGFTAVGQTLNGYPGTWDAEDADAFGAYWERCDAEMVCERIVGSDGPSYMLRNGDAGDRFRFVVWFSNSTGVTEAFSAITPAVLDTKDGALVVDDNNQLTVSASGFFGGGVVDATLFSTPTPLGAHLVSDDGNVNTTITIPDSVAAGLHTLELNGLGAGNEHLVLSIPVLMNSVDPVNPVNPVNPATTADPTDSGRGGEHTNHQAATGDLARTGNDPLYLLTLALVLIAAGATFTATRRRRAS